MPITKDDTLRHVGRNHSWVLLYDVHGPRIGKYNSIVNLVLSSRILHVFPRSCFMLR